MSETTQLNPALWGKATMLNPQITEQATQLNPQLAGNETQLNPAAANATVLNPQLSDNNFSLPVSETVLLDRYEVTEQLPMNTGEADLFLCTYEGKTYAAKLYRRKTGIKPEVVEKLKEIRSPYIARLYDYGDWQGRPVEIMEYFPEGSLRGKRFSAQFLKDHIIPGMNEGLYTLHHANILHKDLKPSNIMLREDGKTVALIDFGISSVEHDADVVVTKTGMTPEYSAPETFRNLFTPESDYYSMGICLCELFSGDTPYHNRNAEEIAQFTLLQQVPLPPDMPQPLGELIRALTYTDITHRGEKQNPNRRWTYREVCAWCKGEKQPLPGSQTGKLSQKLQYGFLNKSYPSRMELAHAMVRHWEEGKKELFRGNLSKSHRTVDPELSRWCIAAEDEAAETDHNENVIYSCLLAQIGEGMFCWMGHSYDDLPALGRTVLNCMREGQDPDLYLSILEEKLLTEYQKLISPDAKEAQKAACTLEKLAALHTDEANERLVCCWLMGYLLSGDREFVLEGRSFWNLKSLQEMLQEMAQLDFKEFERITEHLMPSAGILAPQFEAWLTACGYQKQIEKWRQGGNEK